MQRGEIWCTNTSLQSIVAPEPDVKLIDRRARSDVPWASKKDTTDVA